MDAIFQDLRSAARRLGRAPGFTAAAVLTLALGIGANTAMFSVVHAVLLRVLPYPDPDRLLRIPGGSSALDLRDLAEQGRSFEGFAGYRPHAFDVPGDLQAERLDGAALSGDAFRILGVAAARGRVLEKADDVTGGARVVVVSDTFWRRRLGADPGAVGRPLRFVNGTYEVVGVMPPGFAFPEVEADVFAPLRQEYAPEADARGAHTLRGIARLRPGVTVAQAQAEADAIAAGLAALYPVENRDRRFPLVPLQSFLVREIRPTLLLLSGAVAFILLIAGVNVVNLLLARAADREREMAVRAALGASRPRLLRQLVVESLLLAAMGGLAALLVGRWTLAVIALVGRDQVPALETVRLDSVVLAFTAVVSLLTGILFGLAPGLQASRDAMAPPLKDGARALESPGRERLRRALVASEIALSVVLLAGAGLLLRSLQHLQSVHPGFEPERLLTFDMNLPMNPYRDIPRRTAFFDSLLDRVRVLPGVTAAAATTDLPFQTERVPQNFLVEGEPVVEPGAEPEVFSRAVSPGFFSTLGIPLRRGRDFEARDRAGAEPVGIVNEAAARQLFGGRDPMGLRVAWARAEPRVWITVVGVAGDVRGDGLDRADAPALYTPFAQETRPWRTWMYVALRTSLPPAALAGAVRAEVGRADKDIPVTRVRSMDELRARSVAGRNFSLALLGAFALVALMLAAVGIHGVTAYAVSRRTREIGLRMALGARREDVLRLVLGQAMMVTVIGLAAGTAGALALRRLVASMLYGVTPGDPATFAAVAALLALVALGAGYVPARRAAGVDPAVALRSE
ncbi:MAG TPA: ABC transporter permease [Vicinamibacteria bacterium]|nr:ABC transporter permease [Vicinamibacteria bacterium]